MLFEIKNLHCAYDNGKVILNIDDLSLPKGKLIFFVGLSGIGKSTLIESLGLMSRTIKNDKTATLKFYDKDNKCFHLSELWQNEEQLSRFRKKYFSFIFQTNNLMPHYSAGENMCIAQLIDGTATWEVAKAKTLEAMESIALEEAVFDRNISALSGGQRQRLAFVRAITAPFDILFGDEPTGNLDRVTSEKLMELLKNSIQEQGKSGIIVSHDLLLAERFADMIVLISPQMYENRCIAGGILPEHIFQNDNEEWKDYNQKAIKNISQHLYTILKSHEAVTTP